MRHLILLCSAFSLVSPLPSFNGIEHKLEDRNAPRNPGLPLGPDDFFLARQLPIERSINLTAESKMLPLRMRGHPMDRELTPEDFEAMDGHPENEGQRNGLSKLTYHWPNGVVPYTIDAAFTSTERAAIASGIEHIHENSCIRFEPRNGEADYLDIIPGDGGCYAIIPYRPGGGRHEVGLEQNGCVTLKITVHELLHALGIKHEQCRPDRDDYVIVNWSNIRGGGASQYERDAWATDDASNLPAECSPAGVDGEDMQNCYSGWRVGTTCANIANNKS